MAPEHDFCEAEANQLMRDYIAPSLDTTISAAGFIAWLFARNPDQWDLLRERPDLEPTVVEEVVRLASAIRSFSQYIAQDTELSGVPLPEGGRMMVVYGAANRDDSYF